MVEGEHMKLDKIKKLHKQEIEIQRAYIKTLEEDVMHWRKMHFDQEQQTSDWNYCYWMEMKKRVGAQQRALKYKKEISFNRHYFGDVAKLEFDKFCKGFDDQLGLDSKFEDQEIYAGYKVWGELVRNYIQQKGNEKKKRR